jgi:PIN domain nuclease of toxin-antitoxin system
MNVLLDSHVFLWLAQDPDKLSDLAKEICRKQDNRLWLSMISLWEIQIKSQLGKLPLAIPLRDIFFEQAKVNRISLLPLKLDHIFALEQLPDMHRDPFDRLLVAQAMFENLPLLSKDDIFRQYPVHLIW